MSTENEWTPNHLRELRHIQMKEGVELTEEHYAFISGHLLNIPLSDENAAIPIGVPMGSVVSPMSDEKTSFF